MVPRRADVSAIRHEAVNVGSKRDQLENRKMLSTSTLSLSNIPPSPSSPSGPLFSDQRPTSTSPTAASDPPTSPQSQSRRVKLSPQLSRWSRARAVRSGRKLSRPVERSVDEMVAPDSPESNNGSRNELQTLSPGGDDSERLTDVMGPAKSVYMVSDGTGWTVEHSVNAALGQFEHCLVDRVCPVNTHLFSGVSWSFTFLLYRVTVL